MPVIYAGTYKPYHSIQRYRKFWIDSKGFFSFFPFPGGLFEKLFKSRFYWNYCQCFCVYSDPKELKLPLLNNIKFLAARIVLGSHINIPSMHDGNFWNIKMGNFRPFFSGGGGSSHQQNKRLLKSWWNRGSLSSCMNIITCLWNLICVKFLPMLVTLLEILSFSCLPSVHHVNNVQSDPGSQLCKFFIVSRSRPRFNL